jgi:hypothetical protein
VTAPILSQLGNVVTAEYLQFGLFKNILAHLKRPIRHPNFGTLWERIAEGKTR